MEENFRTGFEREWISTKGGMPQTGYYLTTVKYSGNPNRYVEYLYFNENDCRWYLDENMDDWFEERGEVLFYAIKPSPCNLPY